MRQIVKILLAVGVLAFAASAMAVSCGKTPSAGGNNNNNNSGNNSGGGGGGGGNTPTTNNGEIKLTNVDASLVKIKDETNILLKLSAFPRNSSYVIEQDSFRSVFTALLNGEQKRVFDFFNDKAKEGMVLVGKGNVAGASGITTKAVGPFDGNLNNDDDGIRVVQSATASANTIRPAGLNFFSVFANTATPTDNSPNTEPFAFSISRRGVGFNSQPIFWCTATAPAITATVAPTDKLEGAHKASCYVAGRGYAFGGQDYTIATNSGPLWWSQADPFKREIQIAVSAIRTDDKTIANLMPGADDAAKLAAFNDGINEDEMKAIVAANGIVPFKKYNIKIVNDADFAAP